MTINSREKGKRAERALAKKLREYGFEARRGAQYCGANGDADVVGLLNIHIECKNVERLNIWDAMAQSKHDARTGEMPTVMHKKNNTEWLVTQPLENWITLYRAYYYGEAYNDPKLP